MPESLTRTIEQCKPFREALENEQCRYLSTGAPTFEAMLETMVRPADFRQALEIVASRAP